MKTHILYIALLFVSAYASAGRYNQILSIGDDMPTFSQLPTTEDTLLSSTDISEDIVVMVFLANHCPWVKGMDQDLVKLVESSKGKSVRVVGVSVNLREDDRLPAMKKHGEKVGYNFTYVFDETQDLGRALGATRTPEYFVFDKNRKLVYMGLLYNSPAKMNADGSIKHINGEPSEFYVADALTATLSGTEVSPSETRAHGCSVKYE
ncbi:redoxin family protein [Marinicella sp. W31]|uniref:redoxin family protein n=1 Tax=Marinicella sp. W31 TaxID=3023713 RepID=UPI0037564059